MFYKTVNKYTWWQKSLKFWANYYNNNKSGPLLHIYKKVKTFQGIAGQKKIFFLFIYFKFCYHWIAGNNYRLSEIDLSTFCNTTTAPKVLFLINRQKSNQIF